MEFLQRFPLPRQLSPRLWLVSLPSALLSFERRQGLPRLPIGRWRFLGVPLIAAGLGLLAYAWRRPEAPIPPYPSKRGTSGPKPSIMAGLLVLAGVALLLRSLVLALYSAALAFAASSQTVTVEEPRPDFLLKSNHGRPDAE